MKKKKNICTFSNGKPVPVSKTIIFLFSYLLFLPIQILLFNYFNVGFIITYIISYLVISITSSVIYKYFTGKTVEF